jgi:hypothetical protein
MINKEKLLNVLKKHFPNYKDYKVIAELELAKNAIELVENFPEEPEIDFDALYDEWAVKPMDWSESRGPYDQARSFCDFLKSKNLTVPKSVDIPVKKTWTLKEEYEKLYIFLMCAMPIELTSEPVGAKEFYDLHEEPDYSKIPKGSIVEIDYIYCGKEISKSVYHFDGYDSKNVEFRANGYTLIIDRCNIKNFRIVELAKE